MGCNTCGGKTNQEDLNKPNIGQNYIVRILIFSFSLISLPFIVVFVIWVLFKHIVLQKQINITSFIQSVANKIKKKDIEYPEEFIDENDIGFNPENFELTDVDDVSKK